MPSKRKYRELRIFLACPGDVTAEKDRLHKVVERLQETARKSGFFLGLKEWRQVIPDMGRPQQVIFDQIDVQTWDIFVGILWLRFGTASGATHPTTGLPLESGTHEEFLTAYKLWKEEGKPRILFYRCKRQAEPDQIDPDQLKKVKDFFAEFETIGAHPGIYTPYTEVEKFAELIYDHLQGLIARASKEPAKRRPKATATTGFVDLNKYQEAIRRRYRHLRLETLSADQTHYQDIELQSVFISQDVRNCQKWFPEALQGPKELARPDSEPVEMFKLTELRQHEEFRQQPSRNVLEVLRDPEQRICVILGDPGAGKSSLAMVELLEWATAHNALEQSLPMIIELRHYYRKSGGKDFLKYLEQSNDLLFCFPTIFLRKRLEEGTASIFFDGLDEVFDSDGREQVANQIAQLADRFKKARLVVTSRLIGYPRRILRDAGFQHWLLQDFDESKVERFLGNWCSVAVREESNRQRVRERINMAVQVTAVRELAGNPLLLTMMAMLARQSDLPRDQFTLYQKCSELLLELWDTEKALVSKIRLGENIIIDTKDKQTILRRLAWRMQNDLVGLRGNLVARSTLEEIMHEAFTRIVDEGLRREVIKLVINQLRERNFILCHLGGEFFAFVHRGFLEYFCAEEVRNLVAREPSSAIKRLSEIFRQHCREDAWSEVLVLTANALEPTVADELLVSLLADEAEEDFRPLWFACKVLTRARDPLALANTARATRNKLEELVRSKPDSHEGWTAVQSLAEHWRDDATRQLLTFLARDKANALAGSLAVQSLAEHWRDDATRQLLTFLARDKADSAAGSSAVSLWLLIGPKNSFSLR